MLNLHANIFCVAVDVEAMAKQYKYENHLSFFSHFLNSIVGAAIEQTIRTPTTS